MKYFGIGLSRTGTTTLYNAFSLMGIKGVHYPTPKQIQMIKTHYDFANDTPIPVRFEELDKQYPNSKFIYTVRDMDSWLKSCSEYFNPEKIKVIKSQHDYQVEYRLETYGIIDYDEDIFRLVYETHDKKVREYFKNRPDDLLTINIYKSEGWEKLIPFVLKNNKDIKVPFDKSNKIVTFDNRKKKVIRNRLNRFRKDGESKAEFIDYDVRDDINEIRLFSVVKNEMLKLPQFMDYYRKLGVNRFFMIDNGSTDGSKEYLNKQEDVEVVFETDESFYFERIWVHTLLERYGKGNWCILADIDEMFIYPDYENKTLPQLCQYLDANGWNALDCLLVDMYANASVKDSNFEPDQYPLLKFHYFDKNTHELSDNKKIKENNSGMEVYRGGVHKRIFSRHCQLNKVPLIKFDGKMKFMSNGHCYLKDGKMADMRGAVLHFKFSSDIIEKSNKYKEIEEYYSMHYKKYHKVFEDLPNINLHYNESQMYLGSKQLIEFGIMNAKDEWLNV